MDWETLFERAPEGVTVEAVRTSLAARRERPTDADADGGGADG
jgi:hypothetical protein